MCYFFYYYFFFFQSDGSKFYSESLASGQLKEFGSVFFYLRNEVWLSTWVQVCRGLLRRSWLETVKPFMACGCSCIVKHRCALLPPSLLLCYLLWSYKLPFSPSPPTAHTCPWTSSYLIWVAIGPRNLKPCPWGLLYLGCVWWFQSKNRLQVERVAVKSVVAFTSVSPRFRLVVEGGCTCFS